jgi:hypothetical protein
MVILILGASGSAGGGDLQACLSAPAVPEVRAIARRPRSATSRPVRASVPEPDT